MDLACRRLRSMEGPQRSSHQSGAAACGEQPTVEQEAWAPFPHSPVLLGERR